MTGSHKGLGAAIAIALAEAGANVGCHGRDPQPGHACDEIRALGKKTFYLAGDVADPKVCSDLIEKTADEFGSIDILVNNAGIIRRAPAAEHSIAYWNEVIAVDLTAVFRLSQLAGQQMIRRAHGGKIVNIASVLSFQGGVNVPGYAAAKGGVAQLTKALSVQQAVSSVAQLVGPAVGTVLYAVNRSLPFVAVAVGMGVSVLCAIAVRFDGKPSPLPPLQMLPTLPTHQRARPRALSPACASYGATPSCAARCSSSC